MNTVLFPIRSLFLMIAASLALFSTACNDGGNTPTEVEENLVIGIDPDPGTSIATALGATYTFKVAISSKMPSQGVEVTTTYRKDSDNSVVFSQTLQATSTPINVTITGIPFNEVGTVTVEVKSKSKPANTATKTFKLVRK
jgi:hypothetical protein